MVDPRQRDAARGLAQAPPSQSAAAVPVEASVDTAAPTPETAAPTPTPAAATITIPAFTAEDYSRLVKRVADLEQGFRSLSARASACASAPGPAGPPGPPGRDGAPGSNGERGPAGVCVCRCPNDPNYRDYGEKQLEEVPPGGLSPGEPDTGRLLPVAAEPEPEPEEPTVSDEGAPLIARTESLVSVPPSEAAQPVGSWSLEEVERLVLDHEEAKRLTLKRRDDAFVEDFRRRLQGLKGNPGGATSSAN